MFEYRASKRPALRIDNREIVEALFLSPRETLARNQHLRPFLDLARQG